MHIFPYTLIDLTHTLSQKSPSWTGGCGFSHVIKMDYDDAQGEVGFRVQQIKMHAGIATHMDAPAHCIPGGATIDQLPFENFLSPCIVIDVLSFAHERYSVSVEDIENFERTHGTIEKDSFVMIKTGWERFWSNPDAYRNHHIFPSVSGAAAEFLLRRNVTGLGIDTLSPDRPEDGFPVHKSFLSAGKYIVENAAHLEKLPPVGSFLLALPIKTEGATEAPMRLVGLLKK